MKYNVGKTDRALRIAAGIVIIGVGALLPSWWGAVGAVPLVTGILKWCPAYIPFHISTAK